MNPIHQNTKFIKLRNRLILLFSVAGFLMIISLVTINRRILTSIDKKDNISSLINIAGRQRMLSQSIAKETLLLYDSQTTLDKNRFLAELDSLIKLFETSHNTLLKHNQKLASETLDRQFFLIQESLEGICVAGRAITSGSLDGDLKSTMLTLEASFLPMMDQIVKEYELLNSEGYIITNRTIKFSNYVNVGLLLVSGFFLCLFVVNTVRNYALRLSLKSIALENTKVELENAKLKEQFAYIASHDLQEPVRTITSLTGLLQDGYTSKMDEDGKQIVNFISESSQRMSRLITGLLDYSRLGINQEIEEVDLNEVLKNVQTDLHSQVLESNAQIIYERLPTIKGYRFDLISVFQNLISNAMKFVAPLKAVKIEILCSEDDAFWHFEVKDNGIGIAPKDQEKIFQLFQRLHNKSDFEGVGIGLAHCQRIVEIHRGSIQVTSDLGKGSSFQFTISKRLS